jgi:hypothetical protein
LFLSVTTWSLFNSFQYLILFPAIFLFLSFLHLFSSSFPSSLFTLTSYHSHSPVSAEATVLVADGKHSSDVLGGPGLGFQQTKNFRAFPQSLQQNDGKVHQITACLLASTSFLNNYWSIVRQPGLPTESLHWRQGYSLCTDQTISRKLQWLYMKLGPRHFKTEI